MTTKCERSVIRMIFEHFLLFTGMYCNNKACSRLLNEPCDPASLTTHFRRTGSHHGILPSSSPPLTHHHQNHIFLFLGLMSWSCHPIVCCFALTLISKNHYRLCKFHLMNQIHPSSSWSGEVATSLDLQSESAAIYVLVCPLFDDQHSVLEEDC